MAQNIDLDTTISALQRDLRSLPPEEVMAIIETWKQELANTDVAKDLTQLEAAIKGGTSTGLSLSEILLNLSADTSAIAAEKNDEFAAKIEQIGTLLAQAGSSMS